MKCKNCLIVTDVPGVEIDGSGVCNLCQEYAADPGVEERLEAARAVREQDLEETLASCRGDGDYDCLVPLSGGKDSVYLLYRLKQYGLRLLAFTVDANIPPLAWENIHRTIATLDLDHITVAPQRNFYDRLFNYLLRNQEERGAVYSVSYVYAPLFEGDAIKLAIRLGIPLVLAGYSPGQPEPERMLYEFDPKLIREVNWTPPHLLESGVLDAADLARFYDPTKLAVGTEFPRYLAPFHAWSYDQEELMREVVRLGLVRSRKHANPVFSNYPVNWLLMYSDLKHFGYNPYLPEFADLIRRGKANRQQWRVMAPIVDWIIRNKVGPGSEVRKSLKRLQLTEGDLAINLPRGAYDPPLP